MPLKKLHILVVMRSCSDPRPPARTITRGAGICDRGLRWMVNPSDLSALEEAVTLKDRLGASVTVLAVGQERADDLLRLAHSMGADQCIRFWDHGIENGDSVANARILARVIEILSPSLIFSGNRLVDRGDDPVPALASAMRRIPCLASVIELRISNNGIEATRKVDRGGRQIEKAEYPCTVLFEAVAIPRYPSINAIADAVSAPILSWDISNLGLPFWKTGSVGSSLQLVEYGIPRPDPARVATPDASMPAFDRIISLLSGGIKAREGKMHTGTAEDMTDCIWQILQEEGVAP